MSHSIGRAGAGPSTSTKTHASSHKSDKSEENKGKQGSDDDHKPVNLDNLTGSEKKDDKKHEGKKDKDDKEKGEKSLPPGIAKKQGALPPGIAKKQGEDGKNNNDDNNDDQGENGHGLQTTRQPRTSTVQTANRPSQQPDVMQQQPAVPQLQPKNINQALNGAIGGGFPFSNNLQPQILGPAMGGSFAPQQIMPISGTFPSGFGATAAINPNATATLSGILNQPPINTDPTTIIGSNVLQSLRAGDTTGFITSLAGNVQSSLNHSAGLFFQLTG